MTLPEFSLPGYGRLLASLQGHGYELLPVEDMPHRAGDGSRAVFLRHDIDAHLTGITRLAEIEEGLGARSTWMVATRLGYNPGSHKNQQVIDGLRTRGHSIGVHYLAGRVEEDEEALTLLTDIEATSCCEHAPDAFPTADFIEWTCGLLVHPHDPCFAGIPYVSDSRREWRDDAIAKLAAGDGPQQAHLNLHPEHWLGPPGETRHQAVARITAAMLADTAAAARDIRDGWQLP